MDAFEKVKFALMTEKSIQIIETQNKMVFIVKRDAEKKEIKDSVEKIFQSPVSEVNTVIDQKGRKKAFVKFKKEGAAGELAIRFGII